MTFKYLDRGTGKMVIVNTPFGPAPHSHYEEIERRSMVNNTVPHDDEYYSIEAGLPDDDWCSYTFDTARRLALFEKVGIPWEERRTGPDMAEPFAPFWAYVIEQASLGRKFTVLRHAMLFPAWRDAAMALWRLAGTRKLSAWITEQELAGAFITSRSKRNRQRKRMKKETRS